MVDLGRYNRFSEGGTCRICAQVQSGVVQYSAHLRLLHGIINIEGSEMLGSRGDNITYCRSETTLLEPNLWREDLSPTTTLRQVPQVRVRVRRVQSRNVVQKRRGQHLPLTENADKLHSF